MKPTHKLKVLHKKTDYKTELGVGWLNKDGSITISINPCVKIEMNPDLVYTLFPILEKTNGVHEYEEAKAAHESRIS